MQTIVAVDKNWGIGKDNKLLVSIPADMKFFQGETMGKVVVMGRKTLESFPGGRPLVGRTNIVLTRNTEYRVKGAQVVHSQEGLLKELEKYPPEDVYVIGGDSVYEADSFFPDLDLMEGWEMTEASEEQTYFDLEYTFVKYERV